jgi:hypothetical protein
MFTRHRLSPANKLDCPHAMGTNAFSRIMIPRLTLRLRSGLRQNRDFGSGLRRPLGASTFCCYHRPIRLLRCAQSLRAGSGYLPPTKADESSSQPWSGCGAVSGFRFTGTSSCRACSSAAQRTAAGCIQRWNCPTQAKRRLEWSTRPPRPCPCSLQGQGGELDLASSTHGDQNPRPVAKDATRAGHL